MYYMYDERRSRCVDEERKKERKEQKRKKRERKKEEREIAKETSANRLNEFQP